MPRRHRKMKGGFLESLGSTLSSWGSSVSQGANSLWDKTKHIDNSFCHTKEEFKKDYKLELISFDEVYNYYYKYCKLNSCKLIVSKRYFEKYLYYKVSDYIVYDKFIETNWILNS